MPKSFNSRVDRLLSSRIVCVYTARFARLSTRRAHVADSFSLRDAGAENVSVKKAMLFILGSSLHFGVAFIAALLG